MEATIVVTAILSILVLSKSLGTMANSGECRGNTNPGCHRMCKEIFVTKSDENGRNCSGVVKIWGCGGRCLTFSLPDWQFPHKKPFHQVCIHDRRVWSEAIIPNCEVGVAKGTNRYRYIEAIGCKCSGCNSSNTSCEGHRKRGKPSPPAAVDKTNLLTELLLTPGNTEQTRWQEFIPQILQPPVYP